MLDLESHRWSELQHAYGSASDIPVLLKQLRALPKAEGESEPWFSLWSALAHQGDVYSASFAAVPHVVEALASSPNKADRSFFQFPAWVEICRAEAQMEVDADLKVAYFDALARLPGLIALASVRPWDSSFLVCALSAIAAAKGQHVIAKAVLEMSTSEIAAEFLQWQSER